MARLLRNDHTGPYKIEPKDFPADGKAIWICACGLSNTMPYCDKNHKACKSEQPGLLYTYDPITKQVLTTEPDRQAPAASPPAPTEPRP